MQELAPQAVALHAHRAVRRVADDGVADRLQMHADLMGAAGAERDVEQRRGRQQLGDLEVRHGLPRRRAVDGHPPLAAVAADGRLDAAGARRRAGRARARRTRA